MDMNTTKAKIKTSTSTCEQKVKKSIVNVSMNLLKSQWKEQWDLCNNNNNNKIPIALEKLKNFMEDVD